METLLILVTVCITIVIIAYMGTRVVAQYYRAKAELSRKMAVVRRGKQSNTQQRAATQPELGAWVKDLVEQLGHDEDELYDDEMPDELQQLLQSPLAKSFLGTLSQGQGKTEQQNTPTDNWF